MGTLGIYIHVPYCASRCSYCDFVTYVPGDAAHRDPATYRADAIAELDLASEHLATSFLGARPGGPTPEEGVEVSSIYFGGGTPTLLPASDLVAIVGAVRERFATTADLEVSTEANPDSVTPETLDELHAGGFDRISFGMQSGTERVLATLGRTHRKDRPAAAVTEAIFAGFTHTSLDLIAGAPGESNQDWEESVAMAIASGCDHINAYGLILEPGTPLTRKVGRGQLIVATEDESAHRYRRADEMLGAVGFEWYEVSNWARTPAARSHHNGNYWRGGNWWGIGPGAHSHLDGTRWANHANPGRWASAVSAGRLPVASCEELSSQQRHLEVVMLSLRTRGGIGLEDLPGAESEVARLCADGLIDRDGLDRGIVRLTLEGRLLTDVVVRALI